MITQMVTLSEASKFPLSTVRGSLQQNVDQQVTLLSSGCSDLPPAILDVIKLKELPVLENLREQQLKLAITELNTKQRSLQSPYNAQALINWYLSLCTDLKGNKALQAAFVNALADKLDPNFNPDKLNGTGCESLLKEAKQQRINHDVMLLRKQTYLNFAEMQTLTFKISNVNWPNYKTAMDNALLRKIAQRECECVQKTGIDTKNQEPTFQRVSLYNLDNPLESSRCSSARTRAPSKKTTF